MTKAAGRKSEVDPEIVSQVTLATYTRRLKDGNAGNDPKMELKKQKKYCLIYEPIVRAVLIVLQDMGIVLPEPKQKKVRSRER